MSDLFLNYYRNEFNRIKESKDITFPLEHKEKIIVYLFRYLSYVSLPLIIILGFSYDYINTSYSPRFFYLFGFIFIFCVHIIITILFFIRMYHVRKKFNYKKKKQKKIIQNALIDHFSKEIILSKKDELTDVILNIKVSDSKEYKELQKQFEKKLTKEKKNVTFNYPILSIVIAISIAILKPVSPDSNILFLTLITMIILGNLAIYSFYKDYYTRYYLPVEEELQDITDLLQELIIYKTIYENDNISISPNNMIKIFNMIDNIDFVNQTINKNTK
ncbi:hypothetical protein [Exiguobacterium sp. s192]|uniref:hypothetical protein n=1 Tax=Exiguobacterium sp. s192 TaxID=2751206 RepID=UPI001BE7F38E|nr:hypothetical protein [Exiguobacterium sp. s192]